MFVAWVALLAATDMRPFVDRGDVGPIDITAKADAAHISDTAGLMQAIADPAGPSTIFVERGDYVGHFVVTRPVAIVGANGAVLDGGGEGTVLRIAADDVHVDNLAIQNSGRRNTAEDAGLAAKGHRIQISRLFIHDTLFGVILESCRDCLLERTYIHGFEGDPVLRGDGVKLWEADGSTVRECVVEDSRDLVVWYSRNVDVVRNTVRRSRYGTHYMYAHDITARDNWYEHNIVGIFIMYATHLTAERNALLGAAGPAGMGIGTKESESLVLRDNLIVGNTEGMYFDRSPRTPAEPIDFIGNHVALNQVAWRFHSSTNGIRVRDNDFASNIETVSVDGGGDALGLAVQNNYFSDYVGYDLDGDGFGDVAFEIKALSNSLVAAYPDARIFVGSFALDLVDILGRALPLFAPRRLLVDPHPRMNPRMTL